MWALGLRVRFDPVAACREAGHSSLPLRSQSQGRTRDHVDAESAVVDHRRARRRSLSGHGSPLRRRASAAVQLRLALATALDRTRGDARSGKLAGDRRRFSSGERSARLGPTIRNALVANSSWQSERAQRPACEIANPRHVRPGRGNTKRRSLHGAQRSRDMRCMSESHAHASNAPGGWLLSSPCIAAQRWARNRRFVESEARIGVRVRAGAASRWNGSVRRCRTAPRGCSRARAPSQVEWERPSVTVSSAPAGRSSASPSSRTRAAPPSTRRAGARPSRCAVRSLHRAINTTTSATERRRVLHERDLRVHEGAVGAVAVVNTPLADLTTS